MARKKGRTSKTLVVPVRLDPVLKWAAELAAGKERRSLNSFVEWAVEKAVNSVMINESMSAYDTANKTWSAIPYERIRNLSTEAPMAMTTRERAMSSAISVLQQRGIPLSLLVLPDAWKAIEQFGENEMSFDDLINFFSN